MTIDNGFPMKGALLRFGAWLGYHAFLVGLVVLGREENLDHQDGRPNNDCTIGDVEVGPDVLADKELEEIDDVPGEHSIPQISESAAQDKRQRKSRAVEPLRVSPQKRRNYDQRQQRKEDEKYNAQFRGRVREQAKRRASVRDVRELEQPGNDSDAVVQRDGFGNDPFAEPVEG